MKKGNYLHNGQAAKGNAVSISPDRKKVGEICKLLIEYGGEVSVNNHLQSSLEPYILKLAVPPIYYPSNRLCRIVGSLVPSNFVTDADAQDCLQCSLRFSVVKRRVIIFPPFSPSLFPSAHTRTYKSIEYFLSCSSIPFSPSPPFPSSPFNKILSLFLLLPFLFLSSLFLSMTPLLHLRNFSIMLISCFLLVLSHSPSTFLFPPPFLPNFSSLPRNIFLGPLNGRFTSQRGTS